MGILLERSIGARCSLKPTQIPVGDLIGASLRVQCSTKYTLVSEIKISESCVRYSPPRELVDIVKKTLELGARGVELGKEAPRQWNQKLSETLFEAGFVQSKNDHSLFIKNKDNASLYLLIYVDDLVITGNNNDEIEKPDISYYMHCLSQHMHAPLKYHFDIALRVLKYLELAPGLGVEFVKRNNKLSWKSKRQATLSKSLAEAKYRSMASATCEIMWVVKILEEFGIDNIVPAELFCDNKSSIQIATNPVMHEKTKHFDIDVHLVREKVASGLIKTVKVDTKSQVVDILTKALGSYQHSFLLKN
ncbi:ribonuclease H-like domain-containing protein [Tanacetum coccineum]|uniref:Ribonuclease H-like domain-containing protein n=1 Tax=Tanacetum coccineum TaxID=301880 RepID=A0ABQ4ZMZ4_9ASTR